MSTCHLELENQTLVSKTKATAFTSSLSNGSFCGTGAGVVHDHYSIGLRDLYFSRMKHLKSAATSSENVTDARGTPNQHLSTHQVAGGRFHYSLKPVLAQLIWY